MMQLMPATAQELGVQDVFDPNENIHAGSRYLKWLLDAFEGDVQKALAAYNAGPNRVWLEGIPDIQETRVYLQRVGSFLQEYADRAGPTVASK
jgi:soluble lytic murein transglycosylase-like protein